MRIIAIVGMAGAGKSTVADMLVKKGYGYIRLGQITLDIIKEKGLEPTEENERPIREYIREEHGMAAFATLNFVNIDELLKKGDVVVDNLMSWEEYLEFKKKYSDNFSTLAVFATAKIRTNRLSLRKYDPIKDPWMRNRPFSKIETMRRDHAEIVELNKAGPIAMADHTIVNEGTVDELRASVKEFLESLS